MDTGISVERMGAYPALDSKCHEQDKALELGNTVVHRNALESIGLDALGMKPLLAHAMSCS
jgi:hypothetical protein